MKTKLYLVVPIFLATINAYSQKSPATRQLPLSASDSWLEKAGAYVQSLEYGYQPGSNLSLHAANPKNRLQVNIHHDGRYDVTPLKGEKKWEVSVGLLGWGRSSKSKRDPFSIIRKGPELTLTSPGIDIQFINNEEGFRENFIIHHKPSGSEKLEIFLDIKTNLSVSCEKGGLIFNDETNKKTSHLLIDGLKVWDANHSPLSSSLSWNADSRTVTLQVDDSGAKYPITVDPLNHSPEWITSADGVLPGLLTNLQLQVQTLYGLSVAGLGDVNGDGFDDVAVGAPGMADVITGSGTLTGVGAVFVYFGSPAGLPVIPNKVLQPTTPIDGALFGYSIDAGDITGDGKNDIVIGAPMDRYTTSVRQILGSTNAEVTAGKVYVYRSEDLLNAGIPSPFLQLRLQGTTYFSGVTFGLFHSNATAHFLFGYSVAVAEDLNGDHKSDIIIGSPTYLGADILSVQNGASFIYYSDNLSTTSPSQLATPDPTLLGLPLLPLANTTGLLFGYSVDGAGDFNNDGNPDVVVGAPAGIDLSSLGGIFSGQFLGGSAYIYYGDGTGINTSSSVKMQADPTGLLSNAANLFGYKVKGTENSFGIKTGGVLIGSPDATVISNVLGGLTVKAGAVAVFKKRSSSVTGTVGPDQQISSPRSSSVLSILAGQSINVSMLFGASIDNMRDVNCDNIGDIIVGEPLSTNVPLIGANVTGGSAYVYLGKPDGTYNPAPIWDLHVDVSPLVGVNATSLVGYSVAGAGHIRGSNQGVRSLVGGPTNCLDFGAGLLNLGNTVGILLSFTFDNNGLGKAYSFSYTSCNIALPAKLTSFTAVKSGMAVLTSWTSLTEDNLDRYELQRSAVNSDFSTIALAFPRNQQRNDYTYTDPNPILGDNYYRLKMIDIDGSINYSSIIKVSFKGQAVAAMRVYPNPVTDKLQLSITGLPTGTYRMEISTAAGASIISRTITITQANQVEIFSRPVQAAPGIYNVRLIDMNYKQVLAAKTIFAE
jgi:hypothetical protein